MERKNIVVLGAGFGGLRAAQSIALSLKRQRLVPHYELILIDRNAAQAYTPVLYKYAAAPEAPTNGPSPVAAPKNITLDIPSLTKEFPITFMRGEVKEIDLMNGDIHLAAGEEIKAEFLVVALGSEANYFGIAGMQEHTIPLKTFSDAQKINAALSELLKNNPRPSIVVGGAGANGIELASQIKYLHKQCDVSLVEAMPTILPGLNVKLAAKVARRLKKLGVNVMTNSKILSVDAGAVQLAGVMDQKTNVAAPGTTIPFDLMVWTGGIKAPDIIGKLPLRAERGRPVAEVGMSCVAQTPDLKLYPMIYVLGDSVCFHDPKTGRPLPATAPVAMAQADIVAHNVIEEIKSAERKTYMPAPKTYSPVQYPYVIPVGGTWAAAKIGPIILTGWPAHVFEKFVELDYLISVMPFGQALAAWL